MKNYFISKLKQKTDSTFVRNEFIKTELTNLKAGSKILDAGCGSQPYRKWCGSLNYKAHDFGKFTREEKSSLSAKKLTEDYQYGHLDYISDIWNIEEDDEYFDAILCSEVFEHIPYPVETIAEFYRLLKPGGKLILTLPGICLRHMDPFFFYSGFSDRWITKILVDCGFDAKTYAHGGYYTFMLGETLRAMAMANFWTRIVIFPSLLYYWIKKENQQSLNTLTNQYLVTAVKLK